MHFFFEYPGPPAKVDEASQQKPAELFERFPVTERPSPEFVSRHPPFAEHRCRSCHVPEMGQAPRADFAGACRQCHQTYFQYHRFGHAPVVSGECRLCHVMHVSRERALLKTPQATLCTSCHPAHQDESALDSYHQGIMRVACTACHEAHFADSQSLLKPEEVRKRALEVLGTDAHR